MSREISSPLIEKYKKAYDADPSSRVFAPLANSYRKMGMLKEAQEILKVGIKHNPSYVLGYLTLALCYFDLNRPKLAYETLKPWIEQNRENIQLQKLFGRICIKVDQLEEALNTYKYLLFINPHDEEAQKNVLDLEDSYLKVEIAENVKRGSSSDIFELDSINSAPNNYSDRSKDIHDDEWVQVNLGQDLEKTVKPELRLGSKSDSETKIDVDLDVDAEEQTEMIVGEINQTVDGVDNITERGPLATHTLVDLYIAQNHQQKALQVLDKILELNPNDQKTIEKMDEIRGSIADGLLNIDDSGIDQASTMIEDAKVFEANDGNIELMGLFDKVVSKEEDIRIERLTAFLDKIKEVKEERFAFSQNNC